MSGRWGLWGVEGSWGCYSDGEDEGVCVCGGGGGYVSL